MPKGYFITFEGSECAGKSTHIKLLSRYFREQEINCVVTREPGGTEIGEEIRNIVKHHAGKNPVADETELLLFAASRAQHMREVIIPTLQNGSYVICDRFTDSTVAYQGYARGLNMDFIRTLNRFATIGRSPDLTIILDLSPEESLARRIRRNENDRIEAEDISFHSKVRDAFLKIASEEPQRVKTISSAGSIDSVQNEILRTVKNAIASISK